MLIVGMQSMIPILGVGVVVVCCETKREGAFWESGEMGARGACGMLHVCRNLGGM
jgi:hypothetical protein